MYKRHELVWHHLAASIAIGIGLAAAILILLGLPAGRVYSAAPASVSAMSRTFDNPLSGCLGFTLDIVHLAAHPNFGTTWPNVLVTRGTTVQLVGTAERQQRLSDCSVTYTPLPFNWSATYQDLSGSNPVDATGSLVGTGALTPTLNANNAGAYVVQLSTTSPTHVTSLTVEVVDNGYRWVNIGPDGRPNQATGRVNAIAFDPSQAGTIYIGTANGGVWKSTNAGGGWRPLMDNKGLPSLAIGALAVAPNGTVYAGTGEANSFGDGDAGRPGNGIYMSGDGGVTWNPTGTSGPGCAIPAVTNPPENAIRRILIDPNNSSILYAAGDMGIFRSTNGGGCWASIQGSLPGGIIDDLALNSLELYAVSRMSGVYATSNPGGTPPTWTLLQAPPCASPQRAALSLSAGSGAYVYAAFGCNNVQILRSATYGSPGSWQALPSLGETVQLGYDFALVVDPQSANRIFQGAVNLWRYQGPSGAWQNWNGPNDGTPNANGINAHSDYHALVFDPNNANMLYAGSDGGVYRFDFSGTAGAAATNWTPLNSYLTISQFRMLGVSPNWPGDVAGGLQDNATPRRLSGRSWFGVPGNGGDGYWAHYDAANPIVYGTPSPLWSILYVNVNSGDSNDGNFVRYDPLSSGNPPIIGRVNEYWSDPFRPGVMIATSPGTNMSGAGSQLYYANNVNTAASVNWSCIDPTPATSDNVKSVAIARVFPSGSGGVYYVGLDSGRIYLVDVQSAPSVIADCAFGTALRSAAQLVYTAPPTTTAPIDGLAEDPGQPCLLYALSSSAAGDLRYRVVRLAGTPSAGGCSGPWSAQPIAGLPTDSGGFPTAVYGQPFKIHRWAIAVDPLSSTVAYVGTYAGLFIGQNSGGTWQWTRSLDVPDTTITDIKAQVNAGGPFGTIYAATFGRGVYERVRTSPSASVLSVQASLSAQTLGNDLTRCQVRESDDPDLRWRVVDVEVEYTYTGDHGGNVWLRPVVAAGGSASPYFIRETRQMVTGTETVNLQVIYGAADAPPGLTTDDLLVEMYVDGGSSFLSRNCHFTKTWRRDDARVVEVRAEDLAEEGAAAEAIVPITLTLSSGAVQSYQTPFSIAITQGLTVTLQAPAMRTDHDEIRLVHYWSLIGHPEAAGSPSFSFVLSDDASAVVRYLALNEKIFLPLVMK